MSGIAKWFSNFAENTWKGKFLSKLFGNVYTDFLTPYLENYAGYKVIYGTKNPKTGETNTPQVYDAKGKRVNFKGDFILYKGGKYYACGSYWTSTSYNNPSYWTATAANVKKFFSWFYNWNPQNYYVKVNNSFYPISGKVLFWWNGGSISPLKNKGFTTVFSIREAFWTSSTKKYSGYRAWLNHYNNWFKEWYNTFNGKVYAGNFNWTTGKGFTSAGTAYGKTTGKTSAKSGTGTKSTGTGRSATGKSTGRTTAGKTYGTKSGTKTGNRTKAKTGTKTTGKSSKAGTGTAVKFGTGKTTGRAKTSAKTTTSYYRKKAA
jgi:hypothetical protein